MKQWEKCRDILRKINMPHCLVKLCSQPTTRVTQYLKPWGTTNVPAAISWSRQILPSRQTCLICSFSFPSCLLLSLWVSLQHFCCPDSPKPPVTSSIELGPFPLSFRLTLQLISNTSIPWGPALAEMASKIPHWDFLFLNFESLRKSRWFSNLYYGVNGCS